MIPPVFAVVGHPNKGKSSIVATLALDDSVRIGPEPGTTVHCRRYPMMVDGQELYVLVDTPGFQRARRALHWMRQHETTADRHVEVVRRFVEEHRRTGQFADECELLTPILDGAGLLYVVDGSVPYGEEYEPEMEILRWTGQPSMALINPIGSADHLEAWHRALGQFFKVVRVFNAVMAEFDKHTELLRAFGQLREEWRDPLQRAVASLEADRARTRRLAARVVAETLARMLAHRVELKLTSRAELERAKTELEAGYREDLRRMEQRCRDEVEGLYKHRQIERQESTLSLLEEDLFAERTWLIFGLGKRQLMATGAMSGAAAGLVIDAHIAGASLLAGAMVGAGVGGLVGWWTANRLVRVKVLDIPLGGKLVTTGPTRNLNFPHVVFNRARYHHLRVAQRNHAVRGVLDLADPPEAVLPPLTSEQRGRVERCFAQLRKNPEDARAAEALVLATLAIFEADQVTPIAAAVSGTIRSGGNDQRVEAKGPGIPRA